MGHVIILAVGSISGKLGFLWSRRPRPAPIPINIRPLAAYALQFYAAHEGVSVHLVVNANVAEAVREERGVADGRPPSPVQARPLPPPVDGMAAG